jgi:CheY-specific phosphatase CheX
MTVVHIELTDEHLHQVVDTIWASMLGFTAVPLPVTDPVPPSGGVTLTGSIQISGSWHGEVRLHCDRDAACAMAAAMFGMPPEELDPGEVRDAVGELTNMTGGSIKALLPGESMLGLPTVVEGADHHVQVAGTRLLIGARFLCDDSIVGVSVYEVAAGT